MSAATRPESAEEDRGHLSECLELATRGRGTTSPNPMVGAVVVRQGGEVLGRGYHRSPGEPHAEVLALREAGEAARDATLYTNMEPCCHQGRTPPCVGEIVSAGISRVVASIRDPDERVDGEGFEELRRAGVAVAVGTLREEATLLNEGYLTLKRERRPFVLAKAALSVDARLATRHRQSQWITGETSRVRSHRLRAGSDAVLVGVGTVLADDPRLTARVSKGSERAGGGPRYRVVLDSTLRTPPEARLLEEEDGDVMILTTETAGSGAAEALRAAGAEVLPLDADSRGRVDWGAVLRALADARVASLMIEGGGEVLTSAFEAGIIDKITLFYAPVLIGGRQSPCLWGGEGVDSLDSAPRLQRVRHVETGADWMVEGYLRVPEPPA